MAEALLTQLRACVQRLGRDYESGARSPLNDGCGSLGDFFVVLERVLQHSSKPSKKGYWGYFVACLESNSDVVQKVGAWPQNKTPVGKGRAFVRYSLQTKTLAEHIQVAHMDDRVTRQWYHRDSILRHSQLAGGFLDLLYDLNVIEFEFSGKECLDDGWPVLPRKSFQESSPMRRARRPRSKEDDTLSVRSFSTVDTRQQDTLSVAQSSMASGSSYDLNSSVDVLRSEKDELELQNDSLKREKLESEAAWSGLIASLKQKNYKLKLAVASLEKKLSKEKQERAGIESSYTKGREQLAQAQEQLSQLDPQLGSEGNGNEFERTLEDALTAHRRAEEQRVELQKSHDELKARSSAEITGLRDQLAGESAAHAATSEQLKQARHDLDVASQQHARKLEEMENDKANELDTLRTLHAGDQRTISDLTATLRAAEKARASAVADLAILEKSLFEERKRLESLQGQVEMLQEGVMKAAQAKLNVWHRAEDLNSLLLKFGRVLVGKWQPDDQARVCGACRKPFSFSVRKHHCRLCGRIFCGPCSSNVATLASSKSPARVCDGCASLLMSVKTLGSLSLEGCTLGVPETEAPRRTYSFLSARSASSDKQDNISGHHRPSPVGQSQSPRESSHLRVPTRDGRSVVVDGGADGGVDAETGSDHDDADGGGERLHPGSYSSAVVLGGDGGDEAYE